MIFLDNVRCEACEWKVCIKMFSHLKSEKLKMKSLQKKVKSSLVITEET